MKKGIFLLVVLLGTLEVLVAQQVPYLLSSQEGDVVVLRNGCRTLPLPEDQSMAILSVGSEGSDQSFIARFSQYPKPVACFRLTEKTSETEWEQIVGGLQNYSRVVVSVTVDGYGMWKVSTFLNDLKLKVPIVYVFFTPYDKLRLLKGALNRAATVVLANTAREEVQRQVADVCFAKAGTQGRLPVAVHGLYHAGDGTDIVPGMQPIPQPEEHGMDGYVLQRIDSVVNEGIVAEAYPGCQLLVLKDGIPVYNRCYGTHSYEDRTVVRSTDLFDLGSVTKTTATLLAVMKLYDQGKLKLTDKVSTFLPWLRASDKKEITIRELLLHESGLLPYIRFYREAIDDNTVTGPFTQGFVDEWHHTRIGEYTYACSDFKFKKGLVSPEQTAVYTLHMAEDMWLNESFKNTIRQKIARSEMGQKRYVYSEIGFVILQQVVEAITGQPMDEFLEKEFYTPMGLKRTLFLPLNRYPKSEVMPTVANDYLRRQDICGYVHDETAACMGGISGNAGLFSTASEVAVVYQMWLNGGEWNGQRYLNEDTVRLFTTETSAVSHRGLGFDKPDLIDAKANNCAPDVPVRVFGHTGRTGTCVWADPGEKLVYVFLSNRLCPDVWNSKLNAMKICPVIQNIIYSSIK